jgi:hypothetical protein
MRIFVGLLIAAVVLAALIQATLSAMAIECSVCVEHGGRRSCATVSAPDREQALSQAVSTACATISSGVTDGIRCGATAPSTVQCTGDS